ncbi:MAG: YraN family protein [Wenzhouxiangellaceae bacterium]
MFKRRTGDAGEQRAESFLRGNGLKPVERNWQCRHGEIDLIMIDGDTLVFVEVRLRTPLGFADSAESVDYHKQRRLIQAASMYLARHPARAEQPCRFDVVGLEGSEGELSWIRDAFEA